jgi:hypothetical protein
LILSHQPAGWASAITTWVIVSNSGCCGWPGGSTRRTASNTRRAASSVQSAGSSVAEQQAAGTQLRHLNEGAARAQGLGSTEGRGDLSGTDGHPLVAAQHSAAVLERRDHLAAQQFVQGSVWAVRDPVDQDFAIHGVHVLGGCRTTASTASYTAGSRAGGLGRGRWRAGRRSRSRCLRRRTGSEPVPGRWPAVPARPSPPRPPPARSYR